jgi:hypothetical protein
MDGWQNSLIHPITLPFIHLLRGTAPEWEGEWVARKGKEGEPAEEGEYCRAEMLDIG